ncbi:MAG TPA: C_GCAxxG_C_C family protein [Dehalococcoidia bacterium]|nr:C_GCAxxG_C_C family protein [Dehalococcoidia bacterium]
MEEFGLGNMDIIQALSPFPGFGATGRICGAVSGGLVALGLYFGSADMTDYSKTGAAISAARKFLPRFEEVLGSLQCAEIQEDAIFGRFMDPRASQENMQAFIDAKGYAKCALPAAIGARLAAEIIIEDMAQQ